MFSVFRAQSMNCSLSTSPHTEKMLNSVLQSNQQQMSVEAAELINCTWGWTFLIDLVALWCFGMMTESSWTNGRQQRCLFALAVWRQQFKCGSLTLEHSRKIYHSIFVCVCVCERLRHTPAGLEMVTMRPLVCRSSGKKALVMLSVPKKLTSMHPR